LQGRNDDGSSGRDRQGTREEHESKGKRRNQADEGLRKLKRETALPNGDAYLNGEKEVEGDVVI
jgi:hypothetical protein